MFRMMKWTTPVVALALLLSFSSAVRAEEATAGTGAVSGTVLDTEGKAASGVSVRLFKPFERGPGRPGAAGKADKQATRAERKARRLADANADKPAKRDRPKPVATATTDADGKFTMGDVPAGDYVIMAVLRGQGGARQPVTIKAGETASVELKLQPRRGGAGAERPAKKTKKQPAAE